MVTTRAGWSSNRARHPPSGFYVIQPRSSTIQYCNETRTFLVCQVCWISLKIGNVMDDIVMNEVDHKIPPPAPPAQPASLLTRSPQDALRGMWEILKQVSRLRCLTVSLK